MKELPKRKSLRLQNYDYSSDGCYFITICTEHRKNLLSTIVGGDDLGAPKEIILKPYGKIIEKYILSIEKAYEAVRVENYIIMPNHINLLLLIDTYGLPRSSAPTIPNVVTALKRFVNRDCNRNIWQRSYVDHIIRNQTDFEYHWNYIEYNALKEYKPSLLRVPARLPARWARSMSFRRSPSRAAWISIWRCWRLSASIWE